MSVNGKSQDAQVLCWPGRVLCEDDLRRYLTSQGEVLLAPGTIITPLALDRLKQGRVRIRREETKVAKGDVGGWSVAQERAYPLVQAALAQLTREGIALTPIAVQGDAVTWTKTLAQAVARHEWLGGVVFCGDASLVACVANKVAGVRAAALTTPAQAKRLRETLAANVVVVEMPGRTMFEISQIIREATRGGACPEVVAQTLKELDGHAHR